MIGPTESPNLAADLGLAESDGVPVVFARSNGHRPEPSGHLTYREARQSPCLGCTTSPCCNYLVLSDFQLETLLDVDYAVYLLNFDGILIGLGRQGKAEVYFHQPCDFLDVPSGLCTVHSTPLQPAVCVQYNAHTCAYRTRMLVDVDSERPLLDRRRMGWFADQLVFDDDRHLVSVPDWDDLLEAFRALPLQRELAPPPGPDPILEEWRSIVLSEKPADGDRQGLYHYADATVSDPCQGCGAWCCKTLVFNRGLPTNASQIEFLRYCLGFPGIEVGVSADSWAVIVHTTCRHLEGNRCSVFGSEERPLKCSYYDALSCSYRGHFGVPRPADIVRVNREQFGVLTDSIVFDDLGRTMAIPPLDILRSRLEEVERIRSQGQSGQPAEAITREAYASE
jgi:hypothetical protein